MSSEPGRPTIWNVHLILLRFRNTMGMRAERRVAFLVGPEQNDGVLETCAVRRSRWGASLKNRTHKVWTT
jgi:hypothetical protein